MKTPKERAEANHKDESVEAAWKQHVKDMEKYAFKDPKGYKGAFDKLVATIRTQTKVEERERILANPTELFRGQRIKMTPEQRDTLLQAIDLTQPQHE